MQTNTQQFGDVLVLSVTGDIDTRAAQALENEIVVHIEAGCRSLVLELAGVTFISSPGIKSLIVAFQELGKVGGQLRCAAVSEPVAKVLNLAGLMVRIDTFASVTEAVADAKAAGGSQE